MGTRRGEGDPHRSGTVTGPLEAGPPLRKRPRLGNLGEGSRDLSPELAPDEGAAEMAINSQETGQPECSCLPEAEPGAGLPCARLVPTLKQVGTLRSHQHPRA